MFAKCSIYLRTYQHAKQTPPQLSFYFNTLNTISTLIHTAKAADPVESHAPAPQAGAFRGRQTVSSIASTPITAMQARAASRPFTLKCSRKKPLCSAVSWK